jgi:hypothetical protein
MPRLRYRIVYDDEGCPMKEGSVVLVDGQHEAIVQVDDEGEMLIQSFDLASVMSVEYLQDDRFGVLEEGVICALED